MEIVAGCRAEQPEQAPAADLHDEGAAPPAAGPQASEKPVWELRCKMADLLVHVAKLSHVNGEAAEASAALVACHAAVDEAKAKKAKDKEEKKEQAAEAAAEEEEDGAAALAQKLQEKTGQWQERSEKLYASLASAAWAPVACCGCKHVVCVCVCVCV